MADGTFPTLVSADRNSNSVTNPIYVNLSDGTDGGLIDGSGNLNVILAPNSGVDIGDVDVLSVIPGTGSTNLGKAEDTPHGAGHVGVMSLAVRRDSDTSLVGADGDYAALQVNDIGLLKVEVVESVSSGGTEYTEDVATPAAISGIATMIERDDALAAVTPAEGDWLSLRGTAEGALWVQDFNSDAIAASLVDIETNTDALAVVGGGVEATALRVTIASDSTGLVSVDDGGGALTVDNAGTFAVQADSVIPGVGATNLGKAEDAVHATGDTGVMSLAVRNDTLAALAGADGDYAPLQVDADGALYITGTIATSPTYDYAEDSVHTTADVGAFVLAVRNDTLATLADTDGDYAPFQVNADGALYTALSANSGVDIGDVDVTSVIPGVGATNLGKAEDAAHTTGDVGVMGLAVQQTADASFVGTDGDYAPLQLNAAGALKVEVIESSVSGGTAYTEDVATPATIVGTATMMERDDNLTVVTPAEGDWVSFRSSAEGALWVQEFNSDAILSDTTDILADTAAMDANLVTIAGAIKTEDAVHGTGDTGIQALAVRNDTLAALAGTDGDYAPLQVNADGGLYVTAQVSKDASANSDTNPIFVKVVDTVVSSSEVADYDTASALASDGTDNHDYAVANSTFLLKSVEFAASGMMKVEIQTGPVASLVTRAVGFLPASGETRQIHFDPAIEVPVASTGTVRVIRTNREGAAMDVYSTIIGNDV